MADLNGMRAVEPSVAPSMAVAKPERGDLMRGLAVMVDNMLNPPGALKKTGFAVLMFDMKSEADDAKRLNYISNGRREDMVCALKEFIATIEGRTPPSSETSQ